MLSFLESCAEHFNLPKIKFNTIVTAVDLAPASASLAERTHFVIEYRRSDNNSGNDSTITVDRLIMAAGLNSQRDIPTIHGIEHFKREVLHSSQSRTSVLYYLRTALLMSLFFIRGAQFMDKNILVVGSWSSAGDSCSFLVNGGAGDIYMTHQRGVQMVICFSRLHSNINLVFA